MGTRRRANRTAFEPRTRDSDDSVRLPVQHDRFSENRGVRAEARYPGLVRQHSDRCLRGDLLSRSVKMLPCSAVAPTSRMKLADTKIPGESIRRISAGQVHALAAKDPHVLEGAILRAPVEVILVDHTLLALCALHAEDDDNAGGVRVRQRPNQQCVDDGEDRRVGADAESERERGDEVNAGRRRSPRTANRRSCRRMSMFLSGVQPATTHRGCRRRAFPALPSAIAPARIVRRRQRGRMSRATAVRLDAARRRFARWRMRSSRSPNRSRNEGG